MRSLVLWITVAAINVFITYRSWFARHVQGTVTTPHEYTFIGDDFPLYYPAPSGGLDTVAMSLYDTVHYSLDRNPSEGNVSDFLNEADAEWKLLSTAPKGFGRVRLGPEHRLIQTTIWHQAHCLLSIKLSLVDRSEVETNFQHLAHCMNYLRQWFLCTAANDLEEGDFLEGFTSDDDLELLPEMERAERKKLTQRYATGWQPGRVRGELLCKDWQAAYKELDENNNRWVAWRDEWN